VAKPKKIRAVRPNAGLEAAYRARLTGLVEEMQRSLAFWLKAAYRAKEPEAAALAQDAPEGSFGAGMSPAMALRDRMRKLGRQWQKRFDRLAPELAKWFATKAADRADAALRSTLRDAGFTVRFKMTAAANDVLQAQIGANVALIRSIPEQHLKNIEGAVMRSIQTGRDLGSLTKELEQTYGVTRRRAAFIARSQNNMATATITRVRQQELGITQARWLHSGGGKHPRPSHLKASRDGVIYDTSKGWLDPEVGKEIFPGELPNCRCVSRPIVPGLG
jgi:SPP1 gp7 family putative phage head morphogenesis protein